LDITFEKDLLTVLNASAAVKSLLESFIVDQQVHASV